jgi:DNA polymerase-3 subunit delta'
MSFAELKGQQPKVADQLQQALSRKRLAHAYLFYGPHGSGKEAMARTLAKALNCEAGREDSCDKCDSCRRIDSGSHPDVHWIRPESKSRKITVEQVREFEKGVNLKPSLGRVKVGVVVDADCMGAEGANAFLKTLEEPPSQTVILLLTEEPQRLLPTILSRCLRISFAGSSQPVASGYRRAMRELLVKYSTQGGNSQRVVGAYRLFAQVSEILGQMEEQIRQRMKSEANLEQADEAEPEVLERLESELEARVAGEYRGQREELLEELYEWFSDIYLCVAGAEEGLWTHQQEREAIRQAANGLSIIQASGNLDAIDQIRTALQKNVRDIAAFEVGFLKLAVGGR